MREGLFSVEIAVLLLLYIFGSCSVPFLGRGLELMTMTMNTSPQDSSDQPRLQIRDSQSIHIHVKFDQVIICSGNVRLHNQYKSIVSSVLPERNARWQRDMDCMRQKNNIIVSKGWY